jgi:hypothetical protein
MKKSSAAVLLLMGGMVTGTGCSHDESLPVLAPSPERSGLTLQTEVGPVNVLSVRATPRGGRCARVRVARGDGVDVVRTLTVEGNDVPGVPGSYDLTFSVHDQDRRTFRIVHRVRPGSPRFLEARLETGNDALCFKAEPGPGGIHVDAERSTGGEGRRLSRIVDPRHLGDRRYVRAVREDLLRFCSSGSLLDHPDGKLLMAVLEAPGWGGYLGKSDPEDPEEPKPKDDGTEKNIQRVCAVASFLNLVSCATLPFFPPSWIVCVPATGTVLACLGHQIQQAFTSDDEEPCPCGDEGKGRREEQ